jgi:hypothetical protein
VIANGRARNSALAAPFTTLRSMAPLSAVELIRIPAAIAVPLSTKLPR